MSDFLVEHRLTVSGTCPQDTSVKDVYNCVVSSERTIPVEWIVAEVKAITARGPIYQEDLTRELAGVLEAEVVTYGIHSGVYTTCRCRA